MVDPDEHEGANMSFTINHIIIENGANWSMGQKKLVCLGRVLLKRSQVLVLDEAIALVDTATDNLNQQTLRKHFSDCTVITIAHKITFVIDIDMVLLLDHGWAVMVCSPAVHLNFAKYEDPVVFNPLRWEQPGMEMSDGSKNFMAFGGGPRYCTGANFVKLQMTIFFHYLATKYRWMIVKGGDIVRRPGLIFPYGIHIQPTEKEGNERKIVV
ncbi:hypothetical protein GIB67_018255 [Kingdonia uniflora]|uniref:Cytochrome P450 n=1 Tax=Kingdonia uniflora TaxID=39325 RepID=A0A7J7LEW5_9MAGN|nr:hypothetical protein GIB67_018255 [Kingdonia uniflora]